MPSSLAKPESCPSVADYRDISPRWRAGRSMTNIPA